MNMNAARKVYVSGSPEPYYFAASDTPLTDNQIISLLRRSNPNIPTNVTLVWSPETDNGTEYLVATVVPQAQSKGC